MRILGSSALTLSLATLIACGGPVCEADGTCTDIGVEDALSAPTDAPPPPMEADDDEGAAAADEASPPPPLDQDKSPFGDIYGVAIDKLEGTLGTTSFDAVEPWAFADADDGLLELTIDFRDDVEGAGYLRLLAMWPDFPEGHACEVLLNQGGALFQAFIDVDDDDVLDVVELARTGEVRIVRSSETETTLEVEASFGVGEEAAAVVLSVVLTR